MRVEELRRWRLVEWASATDACCSNGRIQVQRDVLSVEGGGRCSGDGPAASARRKGEEEGAERRSAAGRRSECAPSSTALVLLLSPFSSVASLIPVDRLVRRLWAGCSTPLSTHCRVVAQRRTSSTRSLAHSPLHDARATVRGGRRMQRHGGDERRRGGAAGWWVSREQWQSFIRLARSLIPLAAGSPRGR